MVRQPLVRRLGLVTLAAAFAACTSQTLPVGPGQGFRGAEFHVQQALSVDERVLETLPPAISQADADTLVNVTLGQISGSFEADTFSGQPGTFRGFAPGFTTEILSRARFLRTDGILVPYTQVEDIFVPIVFGDRSSGIYFYPLLVEIGGVLVPVYRVVRTLLGPYTVVIPVQAPPTYVSPIQIILVPAPIVIRPIIVRPRPRPRPRPTVEPTDRPTRPPTLRPTRPPTAEPTRPPTVRPTRPPRDRDRDRDRDRRRPRPRDIPDTPDRIDLPGRPDLPTIPGRPIEPLPPTMPERPTEQVAPTMTEGAGES